VTLPGPKEGRYWGGADFNALRTEIVANGADITTLQTDVATLQTDVSAAESAITALQGRVNVPVGTVLPYAGGSAPTGFLLCDGASKLRADYAALFAAIGTTFGAADGTHFNVPDLRGRFPLGVNGSHALASTGGAETHTLVTSEMPSHAHYEFAGVDPAVTSANSNLGVNSAPAVQNTQVADKAYAVMSDNATGAGLGLTSATGGDGAHNNMPPFLSLNWIIAA
jgi:microcystin-dependent protein